MTTFLCLPTTNQLSKRPSANLNETRLNISWTLERT